MRRGLKCFHYSMFVQVATPNFTHCPDEEGTEIRPNLLRWPMGSTLTSLIAPMRRGLK